VLDFTARGTGNASETRYLFSAVATAGHGGVTLSRRKFGAIARLHTGEIERTETTSQESPSISANGSLPTLAQAT